MIPKRIHYCWFGGGPMPEAALRCMESWKKYCPEYELIRWDESNYNVNKTAYTQSAYAARKWAFLTDYVRLDVVYRYGGIYLDTDVELIRGLDELLDCECYMGMERTGEVNTGLGFGAVAGCEFLAKNKAVYEKNDFVQPDGAFEPVTCVKVTTKLLREHGLENEDRIQNAAGVTIYPVTYFCPLKMGTNRLVITENTYSIHHFAASWYTGNAMVRRIKYYLIPLKIFIKKHLLRGQE